jgi:Fur family iron response transcriptional regulator
MTRDVLQTLREHGIQPSAQRVAVGEYVLHTEDHPSADQVWSRVRDHCPMLSRATVYNTLNLLVRKGLLQELVLAEGRVVFDPHTEPHHHFVDDQTGEIVDIPWSALDVRNVDQLAGVQVLRYEVVLHGRRKPATN